MIDKPTAISGRKIHTRKVEHTIESSCVCFKPATKWSCKKRREMERNKYIIGHGACSVITTKNVEQRHHRQWNHVQ
jgi:hypothetical protein